MSIKHFNFFSICYIWEEEFDNIVSQFNFGSLMNQLTVNKENDFFTLTYDKYTFHIYFTDNVQIAVLYNDDVLYMQNF